MQSCQQTQGNKEIQMWCICLAWTLANLHIARVFFPDCLFIIHGNDEMRYSGDEDNWINEYSTSDS